MEAINNKLENENKDFEALLLTEDHRELFSQLLSLAALDDLQRLLGLHGTDNEDRLGPGKMTRAYIEEQ